MNYKVISIAVEPVILDIRYSVQNLEAIDASLESPNQHHPGHITLLIDLTLSCPKSLLKATPTPPGYPWVSGGRYVTPEPSCRGLVLDDQLLKEPEPKNCSKRAVFRWFFSTSSSKP